MAGELRADDGDISYQLFLFVSCDEGGQLFRVVVIEMIGVEAVVVLAAIRKLDVDREKSGLYELEIEQQPSCTSVAVNKGMNGFKFKVE